MNLTTTEWIPVLMRDRTTRCVSLREVFAKGDAIADLAVRPHERIALMRLLICIAQAALDGPDDLEAWHQIPSLLPAAAEQYLSRPEIAGAFNLFDAARPFLQIAGLVADGKVEKLTSISKLDVALATDSNSTVFDNSAAGPLRTFLDERIALIVLTFQNFAPGSPAGFVKWNGERVDRYCKPGLCCEGIMHSIVRGKTLAETLHWNLLTRYTVEINYGKDFGKPLWEAFPPSRADATNATETYLGRLVPLARSLLISSDKKTVTIGNGLIYPKFSKKFEEFPQEPTATVVAVDKGTAHDLLKDTGKAVWRELDALAVSKREGQAGGALALGNIPEEAAFDLWVGGLLTDDASVVDGFESVTNVPAGMLTSPIRSAYRMAIDEAETWERKLGQAVKKWREVVDYDRKGHGKLKRAAFRYYWAAVEQGLPYVHDHLRQEGEPAQQSYKQWTDGLKVAAIAAYKSVCGCTTPRQIRAFAVGISVLDPRKRTKSKANTKKNQKP